MSFIKRLLFQGCPTSLLRRYLLYFPFLLLILDWVLKFVLARLDSTEVNTGVSFSLFLHSNLAVLLHLFALIILIFAYQLFSNRSSWAKNKPYLALIIIAGLGNFMDRIFYGGVLDYLNWYFFKNNLSDVVITVALIFITMNSFGIKRYKNKGDSGDNT